MVGGFPAVAARLLRRPARRQPRGGGPPAGAGVVCLFLHCVAVLGDGLGASCLVYGEAATGATVQRSRQPPGALYKAATGAVTGWYFVLAGRAGAGPGVFRFKKTNTVPNVMNWDGFSGTNFGKTN